MAKKLKKKNKFELLAYYEGDFVGLRILLPAKYFVITIKLLIAMSIAILIKFLPEWWELLKAVLPIL
jgi:hypothetical protein